MYDLRTASATVREMAVGVGEKEKVNITLVG